jgi:hypothetical protein
MPIPRTGSVGFLNWQALDKYGFQGHVQQALSEVFPGEVPGTGALTPRVAASNVVWTDWKGIFSGQDPFAGGPTGRPNLQAWSDQLLSEIGPQVAAVQDRYVRRYGWTVNPATRVWEREGFPARGVAFPVPPVPGLAEGGSIDTTGLATVQEGEDVVPAGFWAHIGADISDLLARPLAPASGREGVGFPHPAHARKLATGLNTRNAAKLDRGVGSGERQ